VGTAALAVRTSLQRLDDAPSIDAVKGYEGLAARSVFRTLNDRTVRMFASKAPATAEHFRSLRREPGQRFDAWNSLHDFAYSLLFARINTLVRMRGLVPYLGLLHSHQEPYESLVCDLQEPFRARCDRFIQKIVSRGQIGPDDFRPPETQGGVPSGPSLKSNSVVKFIELFSTELDTRLGSDPVTWAKLIEAQVSCIHRWIQLDHPLRFYHAWPESVPQSDPETVDSDMSSGEAEGDDGAANTGETETNEDGDVRPT